MDVVPPRHANPVAVPLPGLRRLLEAQAGPVPLGHPEMSLDAELRRKPAGLRLEQADPVVVDDEGGEAAAQLLRVEYLVRQPMLLRRAQRARHELALGRAHVEAAGLREQRLARLLL